jgi:hypothetical protein
LGGYTAAFAEVRRHLGISGDASLAYKFYPEEPQIIDYLLDRAGDDEAAVRSGVLTDLFAGMRRIFALMSLMERVDDQEVRIESDPVKVR